jgi:hypothetical protein
MGLFDFLKPKKTGLDDNLSQLLNAFFPKGETDINAGTDELLLILNSKIDRKEARNIFVKSVSMSRVASKFDKERLTNHLQGYCLQNFNEAQLDKFFNYLTALTVAMSVHGSSPIDVKRDGEAYVW